MSQLCARARFWASLRVDGELSELEGALLDAHLARCAHCRDVATGFAEAAEALRAAELVQPMPLAVRLQRAPRRFVMSAVVAALIVAAAIAGGLVRSNAPDNAATSPRAAAVVASMETPDQLRRLRRTTLLNERRLPRELAEPV